MDPTPTPVDRSVADYGYPPAPNPHELRARLVAVKPIIEYDTLDPKDTQIAQLQAQVESLQALVRQQQREIRALRGAPA